jgi:hypoxanthine phosphoribosyltransferase
MKYDWHFFKKDCKKLAELVKEYEFSHILAIERGGVFVANELSRYYEIPIITTRISFYDGKEKRSTPIIKNEPTFSESSKVLIVDDLADSGATLKVAKTLVKCESRLATMIYKDTSVIKPDYFIHSDITDWCIFPWEDKDWG